MSLSLTEDFKTVAELKKKPEEILRQVHRTGRPVVITENGKPSVVMMDAASYERRLQAVRLARLLEEGEASLRNEGPVSLEDAFQELLGGTEKSSR